MGRTGNTASERQMQHSIVSNQGLAVTSTGPSYSMPLLCMLGYSTNNSGVYYHSDENMLTHHQSITYDSNACSLAKKKDGKQLNWYVYFLCSRLSRTYSSRDIIQICTADDDTLQEETGHSELGETFPPRNSSTPALSLYS